MLDSPEEIDETTLLDALDDQRRMQRTALVGRFGVDSLVRRRGRPGRGPAARAQVLRP